MARLFEMGGPVRPSSLLGAAHGNDGFGLLLEQDGRVQDPVLFGPAQLFPINYQDRFFCTVLDFQFRNVPAFGKFRNGEEIARQRLLQCEILRPDAIGHHQRNDGYMIVDLHVAEGYLFHVLFHNCVHSLSPSLFLIDIIIPVTA